MRTILIIIAALVSGSSVWYFLTSVDDSAPGIKGAITLQGDDVVIKNVRMVEKKYNKPSIELVAERSVISTDDTSTKMDRFTLVSHSEKAGLVTFSAEEGTMINDTKDVSAFGNVLVRDSLGRALSTKTLRWINSERRIITDDPVRIYGRNFVIRGKGMVAYADDERVEILQDVQAIFIERKKSGNN